MTGETEVFQQGELGEAPGGGSLTTYRELCSLATDLGQPDMLYKCATCMPLGADSLQQKAADVHHPA